MRIRRITFLVLVPLALLMTLLFPKVACAQSGTYVFDEYGLLSGSEFDELEEYGRQYKKAYDVGVYLLITDQMGQWDPSSSERNEFARQYFESHHLGVGADADGIIFVIAVDSRDYVTVKHFVDSTRDPFSNDSVDVMEDNVTDYLGDDEWYEGCEAYYQTIGEHLEYFATNGEQWEEPHILSSIIKAAVTLFTPLLVALGVISSEKSAMKTARMQTEASNYMDPQSFELTVSTDTFVNRTMSVVPIKTDDDHDGGGWSDMGGGFSGSGGGKF